MEKVKQVRFRPDEITLNRTCPRCGGDHESLEFESLKRSMGTFWAPCPETGQPIIMETGNIPVPDWVFEY